MILLSYFLIHLHLHTLLCGSTHCSTFPLTPTHLWQHFKHLPVFSFLAIYGDCCWLFSTIASSVFHSFWSFLQLPILANTLLFLGIRDLFVASLCFSLISMYKLLSHGSVLSSEFYLLFLFLISYYSEHIPLCC